MSYEQHKYTEVYNRILLTMRADHISFLKIGLLYPINNDRGNDAPFLRRWKEYFPNATIFGFDIDDYSSYHIDGVEILQGDMENLDDLRRLSSRGPFGVILEDASHASHHQQTAFGYLFPHLKDNGIYIIEDLRWHALFLERSDAQQTRHLLGLFQQSGKVDSRNIF